MPTCPLCGHAGAAHFHRDTRRDYWQCPVCQLVFVDDAQLLSPEAEKQQYDLHRNAIDDPAYRQFLARVAIPLADRVPPPARGLDFGCGPGPALAALLQEQGYRMTVYDPFYFPQREAWQSCFDLVTCTEVIEHVYDAAATWRQLFAALLPGGWLGLMTKRLRDRAAFCQWHYKNDPTHVRFYSDATLGWVAQQFGAQLELLAPDVALFRKPG